MSTNNVLVSPKSKAAVFYGNLMKAPPLNRRGRKKWHERYFILRANKTLECYKSKKAAEALKSPRRVIDLRECINLEIGLEYKHLQHVLSVGTFKRSFFFAAPSDALMLQWANVLEKVKNATDGETIEVLDIGLRKSRDCKAVHRVKPSVSLHRFSIGSPQKSHFYQSSRGSKSSMALSHFITNSVETINLRESHITDRGREAGGDEEDELPPLPPKRTSSLGSRGSVVGGERGSGDRSASSPVVIKSPESEARSPLASGRVVTFYANVPISPMKKITNVTVSNASGAESSGSFSTSKGSAPSKVPPDSTTYRVIPTRVPPPQLAIRPRINSSGADHNSKVAASSKTSSPSDQFDRSLDLTDSQGGSPSPSHKQFVPKGSSLQRGKAFRSPVHGSQPKQQSPRHKRKGRKGGEKGGSEKESEGSLKADGAVILHSNMKRSMRYRKITMKHEKPIFADSTQDSSDEEGDNESENPLAILINDEHTKTIGANFGLEQSPKAVTTSASQHHNSDPSEPQPRVLCRPRSNSYSKITVAGVKCPSFPHQNGAMGGQVSKHDEFQLKGLVQCDSLDRTDGEECGTCFDLPPPLDTPTELDCFLLLERPRDSYLFQSVASLNSLDNILVDPPEMFDANKIVEEEEEEEEEELRGGRQQNSAIALTEDGRSLSLHKGDTEKHVPGCYDAADPDLQNETTAAATDRHSTESNDTGYTSSPGFQEGRKITIPEPEERELEKEVVENQNGQLRRGSNVSSGSEGGVKHYVPMVFHNVGAGGSPSVFSLVVCLVEDSDEVIKDIIALKSLEMFSLVDCEEQRGSNVAACGDAFTVETSLEDLEFGFSIGTSIQKDLFMRKVREFQFEILELFGCSEKPFSCDVEIKHADQIITLPIEVERS